MVVVGDLGRQIAYLETALALYERLGDRERAAQVQSRLGMAFSLIDSIDAEHLDVERAFTHFNAARPVLEHGPLRKALGHLETGVATALTYALRIPDGIEAAARGMDIGERLGDDALWAGAAQAFGLHMIAAGHLREGFAVTERAFEVADREQRPFLAFMGSNIRGQWTWGLGAPDEAQAYFERPLRLPYVGKTAYRHELADGVGRCHASRGELEEARRLLADAKAAWFTHSLRPLLDLWDGRWQQVDALAANVLTTSRRTGNRWDEWAAHYFAGHVRYLRRELKPAMKSFEDGLAIVVDGGARYFELWARPELARARAEDKSPAAARAEVERCLELLDGGEDWRARAGHVALAEAVVLAAENRLDEAEAAFGRAHATFQRYRLPADEADVIHEWGRALGRAGNGPAAAEKLDRSAPPPTSAWRRVTLAQTSHRRPRRAYPPRPACSHIMTVDAGTTRSWFALTFPYGVSAPRCECLPTGAIEGLETARCQDSSPPGSIQVHQPRDATIQPGADLARTATELVANHPAAPMWCWPDPGRAGRTSSEGAGCASG